jgi:hypothetical protein
MKAILFVLVILLVFPSCKKDGYALTIEDADVVLSNGLREKDVPVTLFPFPAYKDRIDAIEIGSIKDWKLTVAFPKNLDDDFLIDPKEAGYTNAPQGMKIMAFYTYPTLTLLHDYTVESHWITLDSFIYSNRDGKITREGSEFDLKKGWNVYSDVIKEKINIEDMCLRGYTWYCFDFDEDIWFL